MTDKIVIKGVDGLVNLPPEMQESMKKKGGIRSVIEAVPSSESFEGEAEKFKALSAPVRLQIMHALLVADLCPSIIKDITHISDSKLSYHLEVLEKAGFIAHIQRKKWRIYTITVRGRQVLGHIRPPSDIPMV
ncbi:MAG: metalloregulator ArsR/SmtB family transcription factor [archaeon]|nr:metalloregulator ArsR/SmtB family transcription factor [archaeon]